MRERRMLLYCLGSERNMLLQFVFCSMTQVGLFNGALYRRLNKSSAVIVSTRGNKTTTYSFLRADFRFSSSINSWIPLSLESSLRLSVFSRIARLCGCCCACDNTETSGISSSFYTYRNKRTECKYIIFDNIILRWFQQKINAKKSSIPVRQKCCTNWAGKSCWLEASCCLAGLRSKVSQAGFPRWSTHFLALLSSIDTFRIAAFNINKPRSIATMKKCTFWMDDVRIRIKARV